MNPADRSDPTVIAALSHRCEMCKAPIDIDCKNFDGKPLPGRVVHWYRIKEAA